MAMNFNLILSPPKHSLPMAKSPLTRFQLNSDWMPQENLGMEVLALDTNQDQDWDACR